MRKIFFSLIAIISLQASASHLKGGTIECSIISTNTVNVKIRLIRDYDGVQAGYGILSFGDGTGIDLSISTSGTTISSYQLDEAEIVELSFQHTYLATGTYHIGYKESFRNYGIINMADCCVDFYVQTRITIDPSLGLNNTPKLQNIGYGNVLMNSEYFTNFGVTDIDGDSLSYSLDFVRSDKDVIAPVYKFPNHQSFYFANDDRIKKFHIDPLTGNLDWTVPDLIGEFNAAITVYEWRKINGTQKLISSTNLDFQLTVIGDNFYEYPQVIFPNSSCYTDDLSESISISQTADDKLYFATFGSNSDVMYLNGESLADYQFDNTYSSGTLNYSLDHVFSEGTFGFVTVYINIKTDLHPNVNTFQLAKSFYFGFGCDELRSPLSVSDDLKIGTICYQGKSTIEFRRSDKYSGPVSIETYDLSGKALHSIKTTFINGIASIKKPIEISELILVRLNTTNGSESLKLMLRD